MTPILNIVTPIVTVLVVHLLSLKRLDGIESPWIQRNLIIGAKSLPFESISRWPKKFSWQNVNISYGPMDNLWRKAIMRLEDYNITRKSLWMPIKRLNQGDGIRIEAQHQKHTFAYFTLSRPNFRGPCGPWLCASRCPFWHLLYM